MLTPKEKARAAIEVKKSKFIALAQKINSQHEAREQLILARKEYHDATHVVHAFIIGRRGDIFGMSDDREPRGTAGRPILEVLKGSGITNVMVLVIRYFGGTKLGTGGLVKAYTEAAQKVLTLLPVEELVEKNPFILTLPYEYYDRIKKCLLKYNAELENEVFETKIKLEGIIPRINFNTVYKEIETISNGTVHFTHR